MKPPTPEQADYKYLIDEKKYAQTIYDLHKRFRNRGVFFELAYRHLETFVKRECRYHDCGAAGCTNLNIDAKERIGPCKSFLLMNKLAMSNIKIEDYKKSVSLDWEKRSTLYNEPCI